LNEVIGRLHLEMREIEACLAGGRGRCTLAGRPQRLRMSTVRGASPGLVALEMYLGRDAQPSA